MSSPCSFAKSSSTMTRSRNNPRNAYILNKNLCDGLSVEVVNQGLDAICQAYADVNVVCVGSPHGEVVNEGATVAPQIPPAMHQVMAWDGEWSSEESNSSSNHDCNVEDGNMGRKLCFLDMHHERCLSVFPVELCIYAEDVNVAIT